MSIDLRHKIATIVAHENDGRITVKYHDTIVFEKTGPDSITVRHGGFITRTTCMRITQACREFNVPGYTYIHNRIMHISVNDVPFEVTKEGIDLRYF
jgi:hypothetical protein